MIDVLQFSFMVGFWCAGLHLAGQDGMILNKPAIWLDAKLGFWAKPIITCAPCMTLLYGVIIFAMMCLTDLYYWDEYFLLLGIPPASIISSIVCMVNKYFVLVNYQREKEINEAAAFYQDTTTEE